MDVQKTMTDLKEFWSLEHMGKTEQEKSGPEFLEAYPEMIQPTMMGGTWCGFPSKLGIGGSNPTEA